MINTILKKLKKKKERSEIFYLKEHNPGYKYFVDEDDYYDDEDYEE